MPGTSAIGGLVSGFDTASLVEQLVAISRRRVDVVVNNQTLQSDKLTAFQSLNTQLSAFQATAKILKDNDTFDVFKTSASTDSTNFTADELVTIQRQQMQVQAHTQYHLHPAHSWLRQDSCHLRVLPVQTLH